MRERTERAATAPTLPLDYSDTIPLPKLAAMERCGKRLGLPLDSLERLGQDEALCDAFLLAAEAGDGLRFTKALDGPATVPAIAPWRRH